MSCRNFKVTQNGVLPIFDLWGLLKNAKALGPLLFFYFFSMIYTMRITDVYIPYFWDSRTCSFIQIIVFPHFFHIGTFFNCIPDIATLYKCIHLVNQLLFQIFGSWKILFSATHHYFRPVHQILLTL